MNPMIIIFSEYDEKDVNEAKDVEKMCRLELEHKISRILILTLPYCKYETQ